MGIVSRLSPKNSAGLATSSFDTMNHDMVRSVFGEVSSAGRTVNERAVLGISAAWACRRVICEAVGMLPWGIFRKESNGNAEKDDTHWLHDVLVFSPNRDQTSVEYRESLCMGLTGDGNAYSLIERTGRRIASLTPLMGVTPMRKQGASTNLGIAEGEVFFRITDRGQPVDLPREKVWQVKGFGHDLLRGLSPIGAAREAMGGALAMEEFANKFFSQGAVPSAIVTIPQWLKPDQKTEAQEAANAMAGLGRAHKVALFQGGMKPEPWSTTNLEEMQFIFARRFSVLEICRFYNVPPHMVAELEKGASYASIEQMSMEFLMRTLMPYITRIEASVLKWLLPLEERRKYMLRFNYDGLLRADAKGRAEMYASALQNGYMSRNEVRAKENLNRVDGLDGYTAQTNLASVEKIIEGAVDSAVEKAAAMFSPMLPKREGGQNTVNATSIVLPENMKHDVSHDVKISNVSGAIDRLAEATSETSENLARMTGLLEQGHAVIREQNETLKEVARHAEIAAREREAVIYNKDTPQERIVSRPIDKGLH